jgi:DnaJ-class molecular chaperone
MSKEATRCKKCNGTGLVGELMQMSFGRMFIDFECPRCKGKGYVKRKKASKKGSEE